MAGVAGVRWSDAVGEAAWIEDRLAPFREHIVTSVVPGGFDAYARLLHPAARRDTATGPAVRWREVAAWTGAPLRPDAEFHSVALPPNRPAGEPPWAGLPLQGSLDAGDAETLEEILRSETSTPNHCWFCLWDGWGWERAQPFTATRTPRGAIPDTPRDPVIPVAVWRGPRVRLPNRNYLLYTGSVDDAIPALGSGGHPFGQGANLWWPADRAWCVATEIDLPWTYVSGTDSLIERLLRDGRLEALPASAEDPLGRVEDWVSRWVEEATSALLSTGEATITTPAGTVQAWLEPPHQGRRGSLRTRRAGNEGWSLLTDADEESLRHAMALQLTAQVEELAGS